MGMNRATVLLTVLCTGLSLAADPPKGDAKLKGTKKQAAPKLDLDMRDFGALPTDTKLEKSKPKQDAMQTKDSPVEEGYSVVRVVHGKSFIRTADGAKASAPFEQVTIEKNTSEKFSSVVRVKHPGKKDTRIEVVVLDYRGDTVMEASGALYFRGAAETEWTVDWEPTGVRGPGDFQVLVRIAGNPLGTFPIKFAEAKK